MFSNAIYSVKFRSVWTAARIAHTTGRPETAQKLVEKAFELAYNKIEKDSQQTTTR